MDRDLDKKYGFFTAFSMVVGIVIGSGVFFKAEKILEITNGNFALGIIAWLIGGLIMLICAYVFSTMATIYSKINGIVDYSEATLGGTYGYMMGWFLSTIYYPTLTSVVAWICARYLGMIFGFSSDSGETMLFASFLLIFIYVMNSLVPKVAGFFQISTTVIKLIPLLLMAIIGTIHGLNKNMSNNIIHSLSSLSYENNVSSSLFAAVVSTSFAYEGWIVATSINAELKDAKKTLPKALISGSIFVVLIYTFYYIGISGSTPIETLIANKEDGVKIAFTNILGDLGGSLLLFFVLLSCLGTLNGLMLGIVRGFYSFSQRGYGPSRKLFKEVDPHTSIPNNSAIIGLLLSFIWLIYFFGSNISETKWFGNFSFDSSELPIITLYAMYIPIFIMIMVNQRSFTFFKRFIMPLLAICSSIFMIIAACVSHGNNVISYLIIYGIIMLIGFILK